MLTDFASLVLAWFAIKLARKLADWKLTYDFDRISFLAALTNSLSLYAIAIRITSNTVQRFRDPQETLYGVMLWIALGGLVVNLVSFWTLTRGEWEDLNARASALQVAGDLLLPWLRLSSSIL